MENKNVLQAIFNKLSEIRENANDLTPTFGYLVKNQVGALENAIMKNSNTINQTRGVISGEIKHLKEISATIPTNQKEDFQNKILIIEGLMIMLQ